METFKRSLSWYHSKIGEHDKQTWEQNMDAGTEHANIANLPRRDATQEHRELLDVDLVKGSTFTKAKPTHTSYIRTWKGLSRMVLMPFFYRWWIRHTSLKFLLCALVLYIAQVIVTLVYYYTLEGISHNISLFEVANPLMFMIVLSIIHTQIVYTQTTTKPHVAFKKSPPLSISSRRNLKRLKKSSIKVQKRKVKTALSVKITEPTIQLGRQKLSSDSSEDVDERLLNGSHVEFTETSDQLEDDCASISSHESNTETLQSTVLVDDVPDVAANAENVLKSPERKRCLSASLMPVSECERSASPIGSNTDGENHVSDTEWENNRVCTSDVAGSDSTSDYSSETELEDDQMMDGPISLKRKLSHTLSYVPSAYDRMTCIVWENDGCKKVDLSVVEIGGAIEKEVAALDYEANESLYMAMVFTFLIATFPFLFRIYYSPRLRHIISDAIHRQVVGMDSLSETRGLLLGTTWQEMVIIINGVIQRLVWCSLFFFLVIVAERSYWQRLQYAKYFCYLTSARRSRKYQVPHFRLNKVKNIRIWLSLRAYLKKRGPQRSVEVIVSAVFVLVALFLGIMSIQLLQDVDTYIKVYGNWELTLCCLALTCYLVRFYSLGTKITKKYRNLSTIITEQINLYLHLEQKPHKKEEVQLANAVLKLAEGLIKELESPYKVYGHLVNPIVFHVTRLVMLSAFSAVISELLGFKLKLQSVKI